MCWCACLPSPWALGGGRAPGERPMGSSGARSLAALDCGLSALAAVASAISLHRTQPLQYPDLNPLLLPLTYLVAVLGMYLPYKLVWSNCFFLCYYYYSTYSYTIATKI